MELSLIVLGYNDGESLPFLVKEAVEVLTKNYNDYEIIVIDDGSTDNSKEVIGELEKKYPNVKGIFHEKNRGVGAAFFSGVEKAIFPQVAYIDGDLQYTPSDLLVLSDKLSDYHMVTGNRIKRADPFHRKVISSVYNHFVKSIYHTQIRDINCGLKIFKRDALRKTFPIISRGPFFDAEVMVKYQQSELSIGEVAISHYPRKYGIARGVSLSNVRMTFSEIVNEKFLEFRHKSLLSGIYLFVLKLFR